MMLCCQAQCISARYIPSWCMVWSMQFLSLFILSSHIPFHFVFHGFHCNCFNCEKKWKAIDFCTFIIYINSLWGSGRLIIPESGCCLTVFVFQITTAGTTATRQAVVTPALVLSSSVTAAAASQITGPATVITTAGTTATRPTQTAPIRVSVLTWWSGGVCPTPAIFTAADYCMKVKGFLRNVY